MRGLGVFGGRGAGPPQKLKVSQHSSLKELGRGSGGEEFSRTKIVRTKLVLRLLQ